ncbi:MAG: zinc ribbon domain-containing protein [Candidatus Methanomethylophilaceae archaeon]|nr:zinc ribbon domain-containing protein [Candidatus Methanomethylophilaceae archaeon]
MDESKFCSECGKTLEPGMQFCPRCGTVVAGSAADEEFKERQEEFKTLVLNTRRNWLIFLLAVYAIPVIIAGIIALVDAASTASTIWASTEFQKWISTHSITITQQDLQNIITGTAAMSLVSGICAMVSLVCTYRKKMWIVAVIACFAAAFLCCWSIFGMIIGFMVAFMIVGSRDAFEDQPAESVE